MADTTATLYLDQWTQYGLSTGVPDTIPWGGAMWKRVRLQPFNLVSPENPIPDECQIWPQHGLAQSGDPTL